MVGHISQGADHRFDRFAEIRRLHQVRNVRRAQIAADVRPQHFVLLLVVQQGRLLHLQDFRAEVAHDDRAVHRIGAVGGIDVDDVRIAGFLLQLADLVFEVAGPDLRFGDFRIVYQVLVFGGDVDVGERFAVDPLDIVRAEQIHLIILRRQLVKFIRDDQAQGKGLHPDLFIGILFFRRQESHDIRMEDVQINGSGSVALAQLIGIAEAVLEQLHDRHNTARGILDFFDRIAGSTDVRQVHANAAADAGQLQRAVDCAADAVHVIRCLDQEARHQFPAAFSTGIQERRRCRLVALMDHLFREVDSQLLVPVSQKEGVEDDPVLVALQITLAVVRLQRVLGVELVGGHERFEAEFLVVGVLHQFFDEIKRVFLQKFLFDVVMFDQIIQFFVQRVEENRIRIHMLQKIRPYGLLILVQRDGVIDRTIDFIVQFIIGYIICFGY